MNQKPCQCLYCGSTNVVEKIDNNLPAHANQVFICHSCQFMFTELEQRLESTKIKGYQGKKPAYKAGDEDAALNYVHKLLTKNKSKDKFSYLWNVALVYLFDANTPIQHPLEFMIYRDICQIGSAMHHNHILQESQNYKPRTDSNLLMDVLINNLNHLDYYLQSYDEEKRFATLKRLGDAMLILGSSSIDYGRLTDLKAEKFLNTNMEKRTTAMLILAEYLQRLQNTAHGLEYLKMAKALLRKCLGTNEAQVITYFEARSYHENEILVPRYHNVCSLRSYAIPDSTYRLIKEKLQIIDTIIKQIDSSYSPKWHESVKAVAQLLAIIISVYAIIHFFGSNISQFVLTHKDFSFRMLQLVGFSIIAFFFYGILRVLYTVLSSRGYLDKELNKSKELYKLLYTNHS